MRGALVERPTHGAFIIAVCVGTSIVTAFEVGCSRAQSRGRSRLANDAALVAKSRFRHLPLGWEKVGKPLGLKLSRNTGH